MPVPAGRDVCAACGDPAAESATVEGALFSHGGYGAARETVRRVCPACGWSLTASVSETHSRRYWKD